MSRGSVAVARNTRKSTTMVTFIDDIVVEWEGPERVCKVCLVWACDDGDGRVILRREHCEVIILGSIGDKPSMRVNVPLKDKDEIVLQWRALTPTTTARSEVAELSIEVVEEGT